MCGFSGFYSLQKMPADTASVLSAMADAIVHRGPDDSGLWYEAGCPVGLAHRRLAIVDLSAAGHQPMSSVDGRYTIVFNGEIYNHLSLRAELEQSRGSIGWRGHSDTETLLMGFLYWGVRKTLEKAAGMFAFALWDKKLRQLSLARDRLGEKPLYYGWQGEDFLFGSELTALKQHPSFNGRINKGAISLLLRHNYIPGPHSIYEGIQKLPPGTLLTLAVGETDATLSSYWSITDRVLAAKEHPFVGSAEQAVDELQALASAAVGRQMMADVPLGAFLSGGVDSSLVVALMQAQSAAAVKTFSVGFHEDGYNEAEHAAAVAGHLGTDHHELYVGHSDLLNAVPGLAGIYDEPFADQSQIPTFLLAKMTREQVTVSLSGDGGDELFAGYTRYTMAEHLWSKMAYLPQPLRQLMTATISTLSVDSWDRMASLLPERYRIANFGDRLHKGAAMLPAASAMEFYRMLVSLHQHPSSLLLASEEPESDLSVLVQNPPQLNFTESMMLADSISYLPDDILVKVDRAAMANSLETRVPFLDYHFLEFAWRLPLEIKRRDNQPKWPLRQLLYRYVPRELIERPKMGFGVPMVDWLRGPLRDWAEALLDEQLLREQGYFNVTTVRKLWQEHSSAQRNWAFILWSILSFQAWLESES